MPLPALAAPAIAAARDGVVTNASQALLWELLAPIAFATPESRARYQLDGRAPREGDVVRDPDLADAIERLASDGAAPFYTGDIGAAVSDWVLERGGTLTRADLAAYGTLPRDPVRVRYHGREVLTNPPPSAGGLLIAYALALLERGEGKPDPAALVAAMETAQTERTDAFLDHLHEPGFADAFMSSRLGSTTHVSALDADGWACSGHDHQRRGLRPRGARHRRPRQQHDGRAGPLARGLVHAPAGPPAAVDDGPDDRALRRPPELVVGSAGSNRIRLRDPAGDRQRDRPRDGRPGPPSTRRACTSRTASSTPSRASRAPRWRPPAARSRGSASATCSSAAARRRSATTAPGSFSGGGDPRRGGAVVAVSRTVTTCDMYAECSEQSAGSGPAR